MADISEYTDEILEARYGKEVRGSIVNALNKVNDDNNKYIGIKDEIEDIYSQLTNCPEITLLASGWVDGEQTVTVEGILADESKQIIEIIPAKASIASYLEAKIYCSAQGEDELTFTIGGEAIPSSDLKVYVATRLIFDGNVDAALDGTSTNPVQNKVVYANFLTHEQRIGVAENKITALEGDNVTNTGKINTLETKEAEDRYNNIPVDNSELNQSWTQYIKLTSYVFDNIAPLNWDNLITAETDGYLYISTSDVSKIRMTARLYPADYTGGGYITPEMGDSMIAMPSISIGAYNPTPLPGETDVQVTSPSTACIYVRKGMKIGLFREYDDGYSNTYSADFTAKPFFSNIANAIFYPLVESMTEVEE